MDPRREIVAGACNEGSIAARHVAMRPAAIWKIRRSLQRKGEVEAGDAHAFAEVEGVRLLAMGSGVE